MVAGSHLRLTLSIDRLVEEPSGHLLISASSVMHNTPPSCDFDRVDPRGGLLAFSGRCIGPVAVLGDGTAMGLRPGADPVSLVRVILDP